MIFLHTTWLQEKNLILSAKIFQQQINFWWKETIRKHLFSRFLGTFGAMIFPKHFRLETMFMCYGEKHVGRHSGSSNNFEKNINFLSLLVIAVYEMLADIMVRDKDAIVLMQLMLMLIVLMLMLIKMQVC